MHNRIKEVREAIGKSQTDFAKELGISRSAISKIESGENIPSEQTLMLMEYKYKISRKYIEKNELPKFIDTSQKDKIKNYIDEKITDNSALNDALKKLADMSTEEWNAVYNFIQQFKKSE